MNRYSTTRKNHDFEGTLAKKKNKQPVPSGRNGYGRVKLKKTRRDTGGEISLWVIRKGRVNEREKKMGEHGKKDLKRFVLRFERTFKTMFYKK